MFQKTANGNLLRLTNGNLQKSCCCGGTTPSSCPSGQPEMLLTVTSTKTTTVRWCGQTWNLPADSTQQKTVCPTYYAKGVYNQGTFIEYVHIWRAYATAKNPDFYLTPGFTSYNASFALSRFRWNNNTVSKNSLRAWNALGFTAPVGGGFVPRSFKNWTNGTVVSSYKCGAGWLSAPYFGYLLNPPNFIGLPQPNPANYQMTTGMLTGTLENDGVTYTWTAGNGW